MSAARKRITINSRSIEGARSGHRWWPDLRLQSAADQGRSGYTLVELVFVVGLVATMSGAAVPQILSGLDDYRAAGAARYMATRLQRARTEAITRGRDVALEFTQVAGGYRFTVCLDGNQNGVLTKEIRNGTDPCIATPERLSDHFVGVEFGVQPALPPVDVGSDPPGNDPIRLGASSLASFSPAGTATSGSVFILGRRHAQYVVRIFGATARVRVLRFDERARFWKPL